MYLEYNKKLLRMYDSLGEPIPDILRPWWNCYVLRFVDVNGT